MPLTRYEIRNEYSLANPDLYRAAAKDDPDGLLEGVAMAGLVGIVRQLGDLAEFAAEVFHDLHEEVLATAARGHELLIRVQQLEAELPLVEKMVVAESNYANFAYNPGVEWHANIHNDQNHFTQGDLPRFIRNAYEDCRGPPRLFLLDKFDVAGAGACLKRYTDPSFFRMEWASSELMKAEKEQQDKKARRIKKKGRRQRNGEVREAFLAVHMQPRMRHTPSDVENIASTSLHSYISNIRHSSEQEGLDPKFQGREQKQVSSRLLIPEQEGPNLKGSMDVPSQNLKLNKGSLESSDLSPPQERNVNESSMEPSDSKHDPLKFDSEKTEVAGDNASVVQRIELPMDTKMSEDVADEFASETDNYMDALTTMDSEVETDSEAKTIVEMDREPVPNDREEEATVYSMQATSDHLEKSGETDFVREDGFLSSANTREESDILERIDPAYVVGSPQRSLIEERKSTFVDDSYLSPSVQKSSASSPSISPSIQKISASTLVSGSATSTPSLEKSLVKSEEVLESESVEGVPETPETPEANEFDCLQFEGLTSTFHQLPESAVPLGNGSESVFREQLGSLSLHLGGKSSVLLSREFSETCMDKNSFQESESEASEGIKESSPHSSAHSSANSSIQPMKWVTDFSRRPNNILDSDDELDGMKVSSSSSSSSSSALSSPRPSTLATTVFNMDFDINRQSLPSPQGSIKSSSESLLGISPHSVGSTAPLSPVSPMEKDATSMKSVQTASLGSPSMQKSLPDYLPGFESSFHTSSHGDMAAPAQNKSLPADESEHFPPPPPLPPLEWRMTRRFGGLLSSSTKASESSARPPNPQSRLLRPHESSHISTAFAFSSVVSQNIPTMHDGLVHARKPSTTRHGDSQDLFVHHGELQEHHIQAASAPRNSPIIPLTPSKAFRPFSAEVSPSNMSGVLVQPLKASRTGLPMSHEAQSMPEDLTTGHSTSESFPVQTNDSLHSFRSSSTESADDDQEESAASRVQIDLEGLSASPIITRSNPLPAVPNKVSTEIRNDDYLNPSILPLMDKRIPAPSRLGEPMKDFRPPLPSSGLESVDRVSRPIIASKIERKDSLIAAIASHDKSTLKKVPEWSQSSRTPRSDDREVLLEQIRTGSFSLRHTKIEKQEAPRPVTNINVAAILEKANAIRQAFAGSDEDEEDDDWSDA